MQLMLAEELPTMVLNYWSDLSAYRTDKFDPSTWVRSPNNEAGVYLFGATLDSYFNLKPLSGAATSSSSPGLPAWIWIVGIGAVVVIGAGIVLSRRKGPDEDEA